jgi:hypothetical protein
MQDQSVAEQYTSDYAPYSLSEQFTQKEKLSLSLPNMSDMSKLMDIEPFEEEKQAGFASF